MTMHAHPDPARRRLLHGMAMGGAALALQPLWALASPGQPTVLAGTEFDLRIARTPVNITGKTVNAFTVNGSLPGPILRWREGDTVRIRVRNALAETSSIHWHGLLLPANMDGVPGMSFDGIAPGGDYLYQFKLRQSGTYWYHSHSSLQEQAGLLGPIIIDPRTPDRLACERDYVVLLSDWTDLDPMHLFARMKKRSDYDNFHKQTASDFLRDARTHGLRATLADRKAWGAMRMSPTDLADVNGHTYTYLANGHTAAQNWTGLFAPGDRVRLRFINGAAMSFFDVRIPGLKLTVVAADGQPIQPVDVDEFRIAPAETYDVIVQPMDAAAYTVFAQAMDRSGYTRITLAPQVGMQAAIPMLDTRPLLTMEDMGHGGHAMGKAGEMTCGAAMGMPAMEGMAGMTHGSAMQTHPASETRNPDVEMQTMAPVPKLDDPGIGLRNNGRSVLCYADLHSLHAPADDREPSRTIELHLTGNMERFTWGFDGIRFGDAAPIRLQYGERVRLVLINDTMMEHPIHLHGLWSDLEDAHGQFLVRKHTVSIPPGSKRSLRVTADAPGRWAFHCHMLLHMEGGMMREVRVEE